MDTSFTSSPRCASRAGFLGDKTALSDVRVGACLFSWTGYDMAGPAATAPRREPFARDGIRPSRSGTAVAENARRAGKPATGRPASRPEPGAAGEWTSGGRRLKCANRVIRPHHRNFPSQDSRLPRYARPNSFTCSLEQLTQAHTRTSPQQCLSPWYASAMRLPERDVKVGRR